MPPAQRAGKEDSAWEAAGLLLIQRGEGFDDTDGFEADADDALEEVDDVRDRMRETLEKVREAEAVDWCMLLITDVIRENSLLLMTPFSKEGALIYDKVEDGVYDLPGVLSRKKQLLPEILRVLDS